MPQNPTVVAKIKEKRNYRKMNNLILETELV